MSSVAGLFPKAALPLALGWKTVALFDILFASAVLLAWTRGAVRRLDLRLIAAAGAFVLASVAALVAHPSQEGAHLTLSLAYSAAVLVVASHLRMAPRQARAVILGAMALGLAFAWVTLALENGIGVIVGRNDSLALPSGLHRLGGLTGGNVLVLFLAIAAPLAHPSWFGILALLMSGFPTLSRSMMGIGVAVLMGPLRLADQRSPARTLAGLAAAAALLLGALAYLYLPLGTEPNVWRSGFGAGAYPGLHRAALRMWAEAPITGLGPGAFPEHWVEFSSDAERRAIPGNNPEHAAWDPHSAFLGLAAEQGLVGVAALIWLLGEIFARLRAARDTHHRALATAALVGLLVGGTLVDWLPLKGLWLWIGLLVAAAREEDGSETAAR